ncbi:MAG: hypothetical protein J5965_16775 [Aeriscardovia sp.]|nr:hypothetical protein [Aeriscardovia sp.]
MGLIDRFIKWFRDSAERRRFINEFNANARGAFQSLSVDTLMEARACSGNSDSSYRHELSAPVIFSGIAIEAKAGTEIPLDDIILIGKIIFSNQVLVRRMFVLHWDTLIVRDTRTGKYIDWRIRDFVNFGGLLDERR